MPDETWAERWSRRLMGSQPPALELLVGKADYSDTLRRVAPPWAMVVLAGSLVAFLLATSPTPGFHRTAALIVVAATLASWCIPLLIWTRIRPPATQLWAGFSAWLGAVLACLVFALAGPLHEEGLVFVPSLAAGLFVFTNRRTAVIGVGLTMTGYAIVVLTGSGYTDPASRILIVLSFTVASGFLMHWAVSRLERLAAQEREAAAQVVDLAAQLREMNRGLEEKVSDQVAEIETLGRLRRFLSPQVADIVLTAKDEDLLKPHRRRVSVMFCDVRGFTAFTGTAEPEEIVQALDEYFTTVGSVLRRHNATIGTFAGDGVMAYLNDPVPCEDPAGTGVAMAKDLARALRPVFDIWSNRGHDLGFGIGVAFGYATLATIGFEGRYDYTPVGSVVNLAARLCAEAASGEVLIDSRSADAVRVRFEVDARKVNLKGFSEPVRAYCLGEELSGTGAEVATPEADDQPSGHDQH